MIRYFYQLIAISVLSSVLRAEHKVVPLELFAAHGNLEVTLWAQSPMLYNPTNMDVDRDGRIWVAEGVNYRRHGNRKPEGDRIVVIQDTNGDGKADSSHVFVQEKFLTAPLGVAVIDNKIVVSMTPDLVIYTDVNRDLKFDPEVDKREVLLTGFNSKQHDHSLHSVTVGPDGKWYWNHGNCGAQFTDKSGKTFRVGSAYQMRQIAGKESDDGHVWIGGAAYRMNPDGTNVEAIGHNFRNSYEQTITSFGDVFQNDNDDPPASRTSFLLEYGNAGFCSADGKRSWQSDRRPGQSTPIAEWRQEDPGTMPSGDVYGGGSPTGICFYEGGALGEAYAGGLLLSCEPARNVVFGYLPVQDGAGFKLERFNFLTTNAAEEFAGTDFKGGRTNNEAKTLFRPSDVAVGTDGAIYVADWYDPRVGGHADHDNTLSGAIYRVAPKGFKPTTPKIDLNSTEGQILAIKSNALNVRNLGFTALKKQKDKAINAVKELLKDPNPYVAARATFLLPHLGDAGVAATKEILNGDNARLRLAAVRSLRRSENDILPLAKQISQDSDPAVRRELATSLRNVSFDKAGDHIVELAKGYDGKDRTYLDALGIAATGKETESYNAIGRVIGSNEPGEWSKEFADIVWRLHPEKSALMLAGRAMASGVPEDQKKAAVVALAFIKSKRGADSMLAVAERATGRAKAEALWWLLHNRNHRWKEHDIVGSLKSRSIYNPSNVKLLPAVLPPPVKRDYAPMDKILAMKGDPARGKTLAARCYMCHHIDGTGVEYGPTLTDYGKTQTAEVIIQSIINPSADIASGYDSYQIETKDGIKIQGRLLSAGDPLVIQSMGGITQTIPKGRVKSQGKMADSLMMSAAQQDLSEQDIADITAYLKSL
ncbi:MAG: PVC-type heme-binding CxxCH protein [Verrucomicrobiota bacterium]|nr:c-type cytochrome [Verrucomicrobiales bacterium]MEC9036424.1 PVC-type heme-binding CxxCH protein [Verrucomicrobiota bacterium]